MIATKHVLAALKGRVPEATHEDYVADAAKRYVLSDLPEELHAPMIAAIERAANAVAGRGDARQLLLAALDGSAKLEGKVSEHLADALRAIDADSDATAADNDQAWADYSALKEIASEGFGLALAILLAAFG